MPYDYDKIREQEDRSFTIRGETFKLRRCRPEAMGEILAIEEKFAKADTWQEILAINEERLLWFFDSQNGAVERWKALRENEDDPITYGEIIDASQRAVEMMTNIPTQLPSPLEAGRGKTVASSKAG